MNAIDVMAMTQKDTFIQGLRRAIVVDIGYVLEYDSETNLAKVQAASQETEEHGIIYSNVEVLEIGGFKNPVAGNPCLVFVPRSSNQDLSAQEITLSLKEYAAFKCLPITLPSQEFPVVPSRQVDGSLAVSTDSYTFTLREDSVSLSSADNTSKIYWSPSYRREEVAVGDMTWIEEYRTNGSRSMKQIKGGSVLSSFSIDSSGAVAIQGTSATVTGDVTIDGALTVSGNFSAAGGNLTAEA